MRRFIVFWMTLAAVAVVTTGCPPPETPESEPNPYRLTGRIENMPSEGSYTLKIVSYDDGDGEVVLASAPISSDGSFSVSIPGRVDDAFMLPYNESSDWTYGLPHEGVTVSNGNVKFSATYLEVYAGDEYFEDVWYGKSEEGLHVDGFLFYADSDCNITGNYHYQDQELDVDATYNLNVQKGWNWAYGTQTIGGNDRDAFIIESVAPSGIRFRLYD